MKFNDAFKLLNDEHAFNINYLTNENFEQLKKIANDYIKQLSTSSQTAQLLKYQQALEAIELNQRFQQKYNALKSSSTHQFVADIEEDKSLSISLLKPNGGSNKIFKVKEHANGVIELIMEPHASGLSDDEIAEAAVAFALAHNAAGICATTHDNQLSPIDAKIKALCEKQGLKFFRQTPAELEHMQKLQGNDLQKYVAQKVAQEKTLENENPAPIPMQRMRPTPLSTQPKPV